MRGWHGAVGHQQVQSNKMDAAGYQGRRRYCGITGYQSAPDVTIDLERRDAEYNFG